MHQSVVLMSKNWQYPGEGSYDTGCPTLENILQRSKAVYPVSWKKVGKVEKRSPTGFRHGP